MILGRGQVDRAWFVIVLVLLGGCTETAHAPAQRSGIITFGPHLTETLFALGVGDKVIGITQYCDFPPEALDRPRVGDYLNPDFERITMMRPELLILPGKHPKLAEFAEMKGLRTLHVNMDSLESVYEGIHTIGAALGAEQEAEALVARIKTELDAVEQAVPGQTRPKVLIINSRSTHDLNSLFTVGADSFVAQIVEIAGGDNIFEDSAARYFEASKETIVMRAPDVILEFHAGESLTDAQKADFIDDWQQMGTLPAVRNSRVCLITESSALRPGPRIAQTARLIAGLLHPDAVPGLES